MNGNPPDPPIRELRNRWPFFSEGELKWLLSPKRSGSSGHPDFNEDMASHMAATMASAGQQETESCPGPVPSDSPVGTFPVDDRDRERRSSAVGSSFSFDNDGYNKQRVQCSSDIGSLGPRSLMFQDIAVASGAGDVRKSHGESRVDDVVDGEVDEAASGAAPDVYRIEPSGHPNPFHMNPFAEGLDPLAGEDMRGEAPIVFDDGESPAGKGNGGKEECSSDEHNPAQYFTPSKDVGDEQESSQNHSEADDEDEEEVMNSAVKRMSFALEDGKKLPKFSPGKGVLHFELLRLSSLVLCRITARRRGREVYAARCWSGTSPWWE